MEHTKNLNINNNNIGIDWMGLEFSIINYYSF
jgi:hypothetical protein